MKTCYLDANLLLYFNNPDSPSYSQADLILAKLINNSWGLFLSPLVLDEYFHNTLRFTKLPREEAFNISKFWFGFENTSKSIKYFATFNEDFKEVFKAGIIKKFEAI